MGRLPHEMFDSSTISFSGWFKLTGVYATFRRLPVCHIMDDQQPDFGRLGGLEGNTGLAAFDTTSGNLKKMTSSYVILIQQCRQDR
ncbi:hypothetical protein CA54_05490 [Symmachiella macrocystis]|uniref:Uncharacterized protein n=1 Tax=Symmachiella macrocystis TaxID=2527985 RepID=A0A5C6BIB9_9PLAN|nr:hypothetical protein CA54_05490 [Symmachiella macrocystis]